MNTNRLQSYLSDNGVRLKKGTRLASKLKEARQLIKEKHSWSSLQWQVIEGLLMELQHAEKQRQHWHGLIAQEVLNDPMLLSMVRLCGVREMTAFALGAFIGDIQRFAKPPKLVKYIAYTRPLTAAAMEVGTEVSADTATRSCAGS